MLTECSLAICDADPGATLVLMMQEQHQHTKRLNKCGLFGRTERRKPPLSKKHMAVQLGFAKLHLNKDFWNNVLWTDKG